LRVEMRRFPSPHQEALVTLTSSYHSPVHVVYDTNLLKAFYRAELQNIESQVLKEKSIIRGVFYLFFLIEC
jgi:hypothetical protein